MIRLAILIFFLTSSLVSAEVLCGARDNIANNLITKHGETVQTIGLAADGSVMELYSNLERHTWTLTVTLPNGTTCLIAGGTNLENSKQLPKGDPA